MMLALTATAGAKRDPHDPGRHAWKQLRAVVLLAMCGKLSVAGAADAAQPPLVALEDTVLIQAREARQRDDRSGFDLAGDLRMKNHRWEIRADIAAVEGRLDDPEKVVVDGVPANIRVRQEDYKQPFIGEAESLVFEPRVDIVNLKGAATVRNGRQSINSEAIRYWLAREVFAAGERGRVKVVTEPPQPVRR